LRDTSKHFGHFSSDRGVYLENSRQQELSEVCLDISETQRLFIALRRAIEFLSISRLALTNEDLHITCLIWLGEILRKACLAQAQSPSCRNAYLIPEPPVQVGEILVPFISN